MMANLPRRRSRVTQKIEDDGKLSQGRFWVEVAEADGGGRDHEEPDGVQVTPAGLQGQQPGRGHPAIRGNCRKPCCGTFSEMFWAP